MSFARTLTKCTLLAAWAIALGTGTASAEKNWPRWRGPNQDGHAHEKGLPTTWSDASVAFRAPLKGEGQSAPILWGEKVFLTTALERGKERIVLCLNRNDGKVLWEKSVWTGTPEPSHGMNGWASPSCVTDGERVYAFFGRGGGLVCLTVDGDLLWQKDLGPFESPWGVAACPVLVDDLVIQNCDADADAWMAAFDKKTGAPAWKTKREDIRGWSTPILVEANGRRELVVNGHSAVRAYDPVKGTDLWSCKSFKGRGSPTICPSGDLLVALNGLSAPVYAIRPGGAGDVTATHRAWVSPDRKGGRDLPSPIVAGGQVFVMSMQGILTAYDAKTGGQVWAERVPGNYSAAPTAWEGLVLFVSEEGITSAVRPGPKCEVVSQNAIERRDDEIFRSALAGSDGQVFLRSNKALYVVGRRAAK